MEIFGWGNVITSFSCLFEQDVMQKQDERNK